MSNNNLKYSSNRVTSKDWNVKNEENKIIVNERFKQDLQQDKTGKGYICPICGSGSGDKGTGITENPNNPYHYTCWAGCFKNCDAFDILALINGIPTRSKEAMQYAFSFYNVDDKTRSNYKIQSMKEKPVKKQVKPATTLDFTEKINRSSSLFVGSKAEKYINNRGISTELSQRFKLGYSESEYFPDKQNHPALIIPVSKSFYISRNIDENTSDKARFSNVKGSKSTIFNLDAIKQSDRPIFIVEGAIDALSIMEVKGQAIALNSTSNADLLVRQLENLKQLPPFVLCLDNDKAGQKATDTLITALTRLTARFIDGRFIFGECKDANEILMKNKPALAKAVNNAIEQALHAQEPEPQEENNSSDEKKQKKPYFKIESLESELEKRSIVVKYNLITNSNEFFKDDRKISKKEQNNLPTILYSDLCDKYKGNMNVNLIGLYLNAIASKYKYNPVLDLFNANQWDGQDHLAKIYDVLGIAQDDILSRTLLLKWFWQGHALLRNDEINPFGADGVLVLTGEQGIGKTSFFAHMAIKSEFFRDGQKIKSIDKDTSRRCITTWIAELGELDATFKAADISDLKAFITKSFDEYRLPYGREDEQSARRANLAATVNEKEDGYLVDQTGNRRFWTIPVHKIKLKELREINALQVWLQVWEQYAKHDLQGFRLTYEEQDMLSGRNRKHEKALKSEDEILDILDNAKTNNLAFEYMTVTEFKSKYDSLRNYSIKQIGITLDKLGIKQERKRADGKRERVRLLPTVFIKSDDFNNL